jgi:hypothetical protein
MVDRIVHGLPLDEYRREAVLRDRHGAPLATIAHLAAVGLVAAATAGLFVGSGYFLLLHPRPPVAAGHRVGTPPAPVPAKPATVAPGPPSTPAPPSTAAAAAVVVHDRDPALEAKPLPPPAAAPASPPAPKPAPAPPAAESPAAAPAAAPLSPGEIAGLLRNGDASLRTGDVESARLFFRRAAEAGDAQAALRMGATFDPAHLSRGRMRNRYGDPTEARLWYLRAFDLGDSDAVRRLERLAKEPAR